MRSGQEERGVGTMLGLPPGDPPPQQPPTGYTGLAGQPSQQMLNGQQMQAMAAKYGEQLAAIKRDIELRKWAVDQACGLVGTALEAKDEETLDVVAISRAIHAFLTESAEKAE